MIKAWVAGVVVLAASAVANAGTINFDSDGSAVQPNGFTSVDSAVVHFSDTVGAGLFTAALGESNGSNALAVSDDDDGSKLQMDFDVYMDQLSLEFGNDDPSFSVVGDLAILELFDGATFLSRVTVIPNRNDMMDQSISYSGVAFNRAFFFYGDSTFTPFSGGGAAATGLIEVVDNITFREATTPGVVPLPGSAWMGLSVLGVLGLRRATRRRSLS